MGLRNILAFALIAVLASCQNSSSKNDGVYDSRAVERMDTMSSVIGALNSCSYTLNTIFIEPDSSGVMAETHNESDVYLRGPNKMHVHISGTKGEKGYWYNGSELSFYSFDRMVYDIVEAPDKIITAIDFLHDKYGIDFPASDFLYPTLTDDILNHFDEVLYFEGDVIDEIECAMISATNSERILQMWIENDTNLPYKIILAGKSDDKNYYEGVFTNWRVDPKLPDIIFEFEPPSNSTRIHIPVKG